MSVAEKTVAEIERQKAEAWAWLATTEQGKIILANLLYDICGLDAVAFNPDARVHAFNEGRRSVANDILGHQINDRNLAPYSAATETYHAQMRKIADAERLDEAD